jgi:hypothetical protein
MTNQRPPPLARGRDAPSFVLMSAKPPPSLHRTEPKKSEADQAEGGGFGNCGLAANDKLIRETKCAW